MKTRTLLGAVLLCVGYLFNATAQTHIGAKVGYMTGFEMMFAPTQIGNAVIHTLSDDFYAGYRVGGFVEKPFSRVTLTANAAYSWSVGGGIMYSIVNPVDTWEIGRLFRHSIVDLSLSAKYRPFQNWRWGIFRSVNLSGGAGYWYFGVLRRQTLFLAPVDPDLHEGVREMIRQDNEMTLYRYAIQESFNRHAMVVRAAVSFDFLRRFTSEISYEQTLTPVSSRLTFRDETFAFHQHSQRIVVSLGYRIFMLDKRKREAKNKV